MGENGFVMEPNDNWLPIVDGSTANDIGAWNKPPEFDVEMGPMEVLAMPLLTDEKDEVMLSTECFKKLAEDEGGKLLEEVTVW